MYTAYTLACTDRQQHCTLTHTCDFDSVAQSTKCEKEEEEGEEEEEEGGGEGEEEENGERASE